MMWFVFALNRLRKSTSRRFWSNWACPFPTHITWRICSTWCGLTTLTCLFSVGVCSFCRDSPLMRGIRVSTPVADRPTRPGAGWSACERQPLRCWVCAPASRGEKSRREAALFLAPLCGTITSVAAALGRRPCLPCLPVRSKHERKARAFGGTSTTGFTGIGEWPTVHLGSALRRAAAASDGTHAATAVRHPVSASRRCPIRCCIWAALSSTSRLRQR